MTQTSAKGLWETDKKPPAATALPIGQRPAASGLRREARSSSAPTFRIQLRITQRVLAKPEAKH
jgi:hypothetical protein